MLAEVDLLNEVDLDIEPGCEYTWHDEIGSTASACYFISSACPICLDDQRFLICKQCYTAILPLHVQCTCGNIQPAGYFWKVLQVL